MSKRYYWLKLNEDFFEEDTIAWLEEQENGKDYVIFYLKLCLKSLQNDGYLIRYVGEKLIPYDINALAKLTNTKSDTVAVAMKIFLDIGLVSQLDSGEIYLNQINEMIGSETDVAKRVRKHRARKQLEGQEEKKMLPCNTAETKCNTEIEIEIELDKEIEIDKDKENIQPAPAEPTPQETARQSIFDHWNNQGIIKHRSMTDKLKRAINGALKDYSVDEIKQAITNYSIITHGNEYYFSYKWTLQEFLRRGLDKFLDWDVCSQNYHTKADQKKLSNTANALRLVEKYTTEEDSGRSVFDL